MKAAESLFEFMPYGAPELLQSRRERLASAILVSSVTVVAAFAAVGGIARLTAAPPVVILPHSCPKPVEFQQNWTVRRPPAPPPAVAPGRAPSIAGVPVPTGEPDVPIVKDGGTSVDGITGPEVVGPATDDAIAPSGEDVLPPPDTHVWAEQYPEPITQVTPIYPEIAQAAGVEGLVIVKVLVGKTGRVLDVRLDAKRQVPILNESALAAARAWVFTPALANGRPVAVWTAIPFHFVLH